MCIIDAPYMFSLACKYYENKIEPLMFFCETWDVGVNQPDSFLSVTVY